MKTKTCSPRSTQEGFILVTTAVMLAIAAVTAGSIISATMNYTRNSNATHKQNEALFLADAGLQAALVKLNASDEGNISYYQSRGYFSQTNSFSAADWGFNTQISVTNGRYMLTSTGRYGAKNEDVKAELTLGSGSRSIHALYAHALFAGNSSGATNYTLKVGGTGTGADFVNGDTYSGGSIQLSGNALLRLPEALIFDFDNDGLWDPATDLWQNAYATQVFTNPLSQADFNTYSNTISPNLSKVYKNGKYDEGEAFVDTIGNGQYDVGEPFVDSNHNGVRDTGDSFIDRNGNGVYDAGVDTVVDRGNGQYDAGEEWTEDNASQYQGKRINGRYDPAGGYWSLSHSTWTWNTANFKVGSTTYKPSTWPAEKYEDSGDGTFTPAETYTDQNGIYDVGEQYIDDRNGHYDYGTQASGAISGMPTPGPGQRAANGHDPAISPPDLTHMYYNLNRNASEPDDALVRWGNDVTVTASDYGNQTAITDTSKPEHIFIRNPPTSGSVNSGGETINGRSYTTIKDQSNNRIDDYFFEDPSDPTYNTSPSAEQIALNDSSKTCTMLINVTSTDNEKLYYVDGNVYIHNPNVYSMRFRNPGTRITIVAKGNITISDEFYYNADYPDGLQYADMSSRVVNNPSDVLCLIALKNSSCTNSGNILIGDSQFGTGGSIHALLYAENNFIDNNLNSASQPFISIFGNMTAGNQILLNRPASGSNRTRLDVTLDERVRDGTVLIPGLPHPVGGQRSIELDTAWHMVPGTWNSWSRLK